MPFDLVNWTGLPPSHLAIALGMVFLAGLVRGFAGFGLSAVLMASIVVFIPPVELIPICFLLETAASLAMFRGGFKNADRRIAFTLALCSAIGVPIGLAATTSIPESVSKLAALALVLTLTTLQLFKINSGLFEKKGALPITGFLAGFATGLASIGGMVIALYVLAAGRDARTMRASLVLFLFCGMATSLLTLLYFGLLDDAALRRGLLFAPVVLAGVYAGSHLFSQNLQKLYKSICLYLLVLLSLAGLIKLVAS